MANGTHRAVVMLAAVLALGLPGRAGAGELGNLAPGEGATAYRWSRGGNVIPLVDREGRFTELEAIWVRDALDRLPDGFIRKAIAGGMHRIYRDGAIPAATWQKLTPAENSKSGVTVPIAPYLYLAPGNGAIQDPAKAYRTVVHELGHCVQWGESGYGTLTIGTPGFTAISWTTGVPSTGLKSWDRFVSDYARGPHMEDYAEAAAT